jgi:NADH-quinone oxidoreductase subunit A
MKISRKNASHKWFALDAASRGSYKKRVEGQLIQYLPVLILLGVAAAFAAGNLIVSKLIGKRAHTDEVKDTPYECGMLPEGAGSTRMSVKFYLIAMLFILFDIEVVFLYPWAVVYKEMLLESGGLILACMLSFLGILLVGYIYAIKKKAFDWKR